MVQSQKNDKVNFHIRKMELEDLERAAFIEAECFSMPWSEKSLKECLLNGRSFYLVAEYGQEIIGHCGLHPVCGEGEITNVAVLPRYRKSGIGSELLAELLRLGKEQGVQAFTLEVRVSNEAAIRLYQKYDFQSEGIRKGFYDKPKEDALIMWKR